MNIRKIKKAGLPLHVFPCEVSDFIRDFAKGSGSQESFVACGVLACAAEISIKHEITLKGGYKEKSNLFIAVVGAPGVNKSSPIKMALRPLMRVEADNNRKYKTAYKQWESDGKKKMTAQERASHMASKPERSACHVITDGSIEAMYLHLEAMSDGGKAPHCVYVKDELKAFFGGMDKYKSKGGDEYETWLSLFSGFDLVKTLVSRTLFVPEARSTVIGGIQPEVYNQCMADKGDGMIDRFLMAIHEQGPSKTDIYAQCSDDVIKKYCDFMLEARDMEAQKYHLWGGSERDAVLSEVQAFHEWCSSVGETHDTGAFKKWEQCFYRVIIILSVLWDRESVSVDTIQKARELMQFFVANWLTAKMMSETSEEDKFKAKIISAIRKHGKMGLRDIQRRCKIGKADFSKKIVSEMVEDGELKQMNDASENIRKAFFVLGEV